VGGRFEMRGQQRSRCRRCQNVAHWHLTGWLPKESL
jgi:hypothetical protein